MGNHLRVSTWMPESRTEERRVGQTGEVGEVAQEGLRKELDLAVGSVWPRESLYVGYYRKKLCLGDKVVNGQMTVPHTGSLGPFGVRATDFASGDLSQHPTLL